MSNHCHLHECQHENVKYCKSCKDIYCVDCKRTWADPCTKMHYPNYYYHYPYHTNPYITWTSTASGTASGTEYTGLRSTTTSVSSFNIDNVSETTSAPNNVCTNH